MKRVIPSLAIALLATLAHANIFYHDNRIGMSRDFGTPYTAIGAIMNMETGKGGTAFLIGTRHVLCNFSELMDSEHNIRHHVFRFGVGPSGLKSFSEFATAIPVIWGKYFENGQINAHEDWVLLELNSALGKEFGYLKLQASPLPDDSINLRLAGFPLDRDLRDLWVDPICHIHGPALNGLWLHDCASRPRNSGSPLLAMSGFRVLAIHTGALHEVPDVLPHYDRAFANYAVPVAQFLSKIRVYVPELH